MLRFFDAGEVLPMRAYMAEELVARLGPYEPAGNRDFFTIVTRHDPRPLLSHFYHWQLTGDDSDVRRIMRAYQGQEG